MIHRDTDQILLLNLGPAHRPLTGGLECLGKAWEPPTACFIV